MTAQTSVGMSAIILKNFARGLDVFLVADLTGEIMGWRLGWRQRGQ